MTVLTDKEFARAIEDAATIVELAQALGSSAKTRTGARRYVLERIGKTRSVFRRGERAGYHARMGSRRMNRVTRRMQQRSFRIGDRIRALETGSYLSRLRRFARLPEGLKDAIEDQLGEPFADRQRRFALGIPSRPEISPFDLAPNAWGYAVLGGWVVIASEHRTVDWNYYPKSYRFPRETVENRRVTFRRLRRGKVEERVVKLDAWRGDWLADAALSAGIVEPKRGLMRYRRHAAYDVEPHYDGLGLTAYHRSLAGHPAGVALGDGEGTIVHAPDFRAAAVELDRKRSAKRARAASEHEKVIDLDFAVRVAGFCVPGVEEFAHAVGFDPRGAYSLAEIREALTRHPRLREIYADELRHLERLVARRAAREGSLA